MSAETGAAETGAREPGGTGDAGRLAELRAKIDAIDESVHRLLMQRASVIDELIAAKGAGRNGAAFRPGREADMMRRLAARHAGHLPLAAVEHLWREIISTFTALQAPFEVVASAGRDPVAAAEMARFYCGFSVALHLAPDAPRAVAMLEGRTDRLAVVVLANEAAPWWEDLGEVQIVMRLPFLETEGRQAAHAALLLAPPLADPVPFEIECFVLPAGAPLPAGASRLAGGADGASALVAAPRGTLAPGLDIRPVGGYAAPLRAGA